MLFESKSILAILHFINYTDLSLKTHYLNNQTNFPNSKTRFLSVCRHFSNWCYTKHC